MKKVLMIVAVAGFLTSCSNAADTADRTKDSLDSISKLQKESVQDAADTAKKNIDSATQAQKNLVDTLNKGADTTKSKM